MGRKTFLGFNFLIGLALTVLAWVLVYNLTGASVPDPIKNVAAVLAGGRTFLTVAGLFAWVYQSCEDD